MSTLSETTNANPNNVDCGELPMWGTAELPEPLPFSLKNALRTIGPGAILLVAAIGGGEWIVGPMTALKYGAGILWVATVAILLQMTFNLEAVRYTLYTGEPIITGFMRLSPGPRFWATFYLVLGALQLATPALAAGSANVLVMAIWGKADPDRIYYVGIGVILMTVVLLQSGKSIEKVLERLSWMMMVYIFSFLIIVNLLFVPAAGWTKVLSGFVSFGTRPPNVDITLLALFAATSGSGGLGNLVISNWFRDKGFGMGKYMGSFGSMLRAEGSELKPIGNTFPVTPENVSRWKTWWRYSLIDQSGLWAVGCFVGMFLNVNLVLAIMPAGMEFKDYEAGTYQATYLAEHGWSGLWVLALLNGFWILYSTHLGNTDTLVRTSADILWSSSPTWRSFPSSRVYAGILAIVTCWALFSIRLGGVVKLFQILGIVASPIMAIAAVQILRVNTRFLPPEFRPSWIRRIGLVLCAVAYGAMTVALIYDLYQKNFGK